MYTLKEVFNFISDEAYKKDLVENSGVSNDRLTRLMDPKNGGRVADLIDVLEVYGFKLSATRDGLVMPIKAMEK
jgi:hypothetical protein